MAFNGNLDVLPPGTLIEDLFTVEADEDIDPTVACALIRSNRSLKNQNIYLENLYQLLFLYNLVPNLHKVINRLLPYVILKVLY